MNKYKSSTQAIVEAGLLAAIILVTYIITNYVPVIGVVFSFVLPIPLTILYLRRGIKISVMTVFINTIIMAMISNPLTAISTTVLYSLTGLTVGYGIKRQWESTRIIAISTISNILGLVLNIFITVYLVLGDNIYKVLNEQIDIIKSSLDTALKVYNTMGINIDESQVDIVKELLTLDNVLILLPIFLLSSGFIFSLINYNITKGIGKRLNIKIKGVKSFSSWYIDNRLGGIVIIVTLIFLILSNQGIYFGTVMVVVFSSILKITLALIGCSNLSYFLKNKLKLRKGLVLIACVISFIDPRLGNILVSIGLSDLIFDFRGLDPNSLSAALKEVLIRKMKK